MPILRTFLYIKNGFSFAIANGLTKIVSQRDEVIGGCSGYYTQVLGLCRCLYF